MTILPAIALGLWTAFSAVLPQELPDSLAGRLRGLGDAERSVALRGIAEDLEDQAPAEALEYALLSVEALRAEPNDTLEIRARLLVAHIYRELGHLDSSSVEVERAAAIAERWGDQSLLAEVHYEAGNQFLSQRLLDDALEHYLAALPYLQSSGPEDRLASLFEVIGLAYLLRARQTGDSLDYRPALDYNQQALDIKLERGLSRDLGNAYSNRGVMLRDIGRLGEALEVNQRALAIREQLGEKSNIALSLNNVGMVLQDLRRDQEALGYFERAAALKSELGLQASLANTLVNLAEINLRLGRRDRALAAAEQARQLVDAENLGEWRDVHRALYAIHKAMGDPAASLHALEIFHSADSTITSRERQTNFAELQAVQVRREKEVLEQQKAQLEREAEIDRLRTFLLVAVLVGLGIVLSLLYSRYRLRMRSNAALTKALSDLEYSMMQLTETQDRLIYAEKMASLGQLTAGIAHEIKNPLNFINNFSDLSVEITSDLLERFEADPDARIADVAHDLQDLRSNAQQVAKHGHRADAIVRSMLEHSRTSPGEVRPIDLNALVDEYIKLAFHGARASNPGLQVELETRLDPLLETVNCIPQDIGRVLINLLTNAFYAVDHQSRLADCPPEYEPHVRVFTRKDGAYAEIVVADNGYGIPKDVQARIFEPFFTTKPTGTGTGLGLSLSFDIITRGHGGDMTVHSVEGEGATFTVRLPLRRESDKIWEESIETSTEPESA